MAPGHPRNEARGEGRRETPLCDMEPTSSCCFAACSSTSKTLDRTSGPAFPFLWQDGNANPSEEHSRDDKESPVRTAGNRRRPFSCHDAPWTLVGRRRMPRTTRPRVRQTPAPRRTHPRSARPRRPTNSRGRLSPGPAPPVSSGAHRL